MCVRVFAIGNIKIIHFSFFFLFRQRSLSNTILDSIVSIFQRYEIYKYRVKSINDTCSVRFLKLVFEIRFFVIIIIFRSHFSRIFHRWNFVLLLPKNDPLSHENEYFLLEESKTKENNFGYR